MNEHRRSIARDFGLNILASALLTGVTQLLVYPGLSRMIEPSEYGSLLTAMAIVNVIGSSLGGSLNNTRILMQSDYDRQGAIGDYNMIFVMLAMVTVPLAAAILSLTGLARGVNLAGAVIVALLVLWRAYYSASYRIRIDYRKNLVSSAVGVAGYLLGMMLARGTGYWSLAFVAGEFFACLYIAFTGHIVREGIRRTGLLVPTLRKYGLLFAGTALGALNLYLDRLLVYPMLGASEVTTYVVASFLGKSAGLLMGPVAGVLLTYYAKATTFSRARFLRQLGFMAFSSAAGYLLILLLGKPVTAMLYPTIAESAMPYFAVANLASIVFVAGNMIHPSVLRFCDARWQPALQGGYLLTYIGVGALGAHFAGLWGLCWAVLGVNVIRCGVMIALVLGKRDATSDARYQQGEGPEVSGMV
ncbi:MAG: Uncharacterized protein XD74_1599 [Actinobacteria bacterium 66_15]|nr:MAG: Uncharacterized protein XD74_1599 [Actinobacteria bacterium 66_15]